MNQTAVDYLVDQLPIRVVDKFKQEISKAKQMEKQAIIDTYDQGFGDGMNVDGETEDNDYCGDGEQYYNETYGH